MGKARVFGFHPLPRGKIEPCQGVRRCDAKESPENLRGRVVRVRKGRTKRGAFGLYGGKRG